MRYGSLVLLAFGLATDATAVAALCGLAARHLRVMEAMRLAVLFGIAQAIMPTLGWLAGVRFASFLADWDHWVAFGLLGTLGAKMIHDSWSPHESRDPAKHSFAWKALTALAIATSLDAFAAGITLPLLHIPLVIAASVIGVVTSVMAFGGVYIGKRFGHVVGPRLETFGGVVLIGIGCKILIEHLRGQA